MKRVLNLLFWVVILLLTSCAGTQKVLPTKESKPVQPVSTEQQVMQPESATLKRELTKEEYHQRVYYLQHRILPHWTLNSEGKFYTDMTSGKQEGLIAAIAEVVSPEFAAGVTIDIHTDTKSIVISFPLPKEMAECYFVCIQKAEEKFLYYTYEKSADWVDEIYAMLCSWTTEGHNNHGGRKYSDKESFLKDVLGEVK